jgi:hypothetical protein
MVSDYYSQSLPSLNSPSGTLGVPSTFCRYVYQL